VTCGRVYGGVLLTVAAAGVFLSVVGVAEVGLRVFSSAPVVAVVSAALGWRLALPAAALLALFSRRWRPGSSLRRAGCAARCRGGWRLGARRPWGLAVCGGVLST